MFSFWQGITSTNIDPLYKFLILCCKECNIASRLSKHVEDCKFRFSIYKPSKSFSLNIKTEICWIFPDTFKIKVIANSKILCNSCALRHSPAQLKKTNESCTRYKIHLLTFKICLLLIEYVKYMFAYLHITR